jgi:hypothetical protein
MLKNFGGFVAKNRPYQYKSLELRYLTMDKFRKAGRNFNRKNVSAISCISRAMSIKQDRVWISKTGFYPISVRPNQSGYRISFTF